MAFHPQPPKSADFPFDSGSKKEILKKGSLIPLTKGVKVLEIAVGCQSIVRQLFSLARISNRDLVSDRDRS